MELQNELSGISRREKLCRIIREKGQITARQAAELFGVSDMTVRRDFHLLEQQGIVSLFHGGARIRPYGGGFQGYFDRKEKLYPAKRAIASAAAEIISENDVILTPPQRSPSCFDFVGDKLHGGYRLGADYKRVPCKSPHKALYRARALQRALRRESRLFHRGISYGLKIRQIIFRSLGNRPVFGVSPSGEESESAVKKSVMRNG